MQTMKRQTLWMRAAVLLLALISTTMMWADQVTAEQAREQALAFVKNRLTANGRRLAPGAMPQLKQESQINGLYVFNVADNGGFVIVSNDDATRPILGFSDNGHIDADNMPDNMRAWLQGYADEIAWLQKQPAQSRQSARSRAPRQVGSHSTNAIEPLLGETKWNQGSPYNGLCPKIGTSTCVTGCVATAMAQVMYYTETKAGNISTVTTAAIPSYSWNSTTLEPIAAGSTINWAHMTPTYNNNSTNQAKTAVATLMKYCGYSVGMNYGTGGSSANVYNVAGALKNYFGYNNETTQYVSRSYYSYANWIDLIYNELNQGRPVVYGGQSTGGGHAFVCDGYKYENNTDFFSINWGWGGSSDGYFQLSVLYPYEQGIGGSTSTDGYHYGQDAIVGIQKAGYNGTVHNVPSEVNLTIHSISLDKNNVALGGSVQITVNVTNNSNDVYDGELRLVVNGRLSEGKMFVINAKSNKDCVFEYTPASAGTYQIYCGEPNENGMYTWASQLYATLQVGDETPEGVIVSNVTKQTATIDWTSSATTWNIQYRPVTITEANFSNGLPSDWYTEPYNNDYWINTPTVRLGGSISFWAGGEGHIGSFRLYVDEGGGSYAAISQQFTTTSTRQKYTVDLSHYSGTSALAFIVYGVDNNTVDIDDITITEPGDWTTINNTTTKPLTLTNLTAETHYEVQVQAVIEGTPTYWSDPLFFSTLNITPTDLTAVPTSQSALISWTGYTDKYKMKYRTAETGFCDDFEGGLDGWTLYTIGDGYGWSTGSVNNVTPHSGSNGVRAFSWNGVAYDADNWLITPKVKLQGLLKFWEITNGSYADSYEVLLSTTGNDIEDFTTTLRPMTEATGSWSEVQLDLSAYAGQQGYIAIHHVSNDCNYIYIDDFSVGYAPAGNWTEVANVVSPYNITGLQPNTKYEYQIIGIDGGDEVSSSAMAYFTTSNNAIELADNGNNSSLIDSWNNQTATVTLAGRTLFKNGQWNTLCLPFAVSTTSGPLAGDGVTAKIFNNSTSGLSGSTLTLNFDNASATIPAGTPFIIKWNNTGSNLTKANLVFQNVTINNTTHNVTCNLGNNKSISFKGTYAKQTYNAENKSILFVGSGSKLNYPQVGASIGAQRAYFELTGFSAANAASRIVLNIDGEATGISEVSRINEKGETWYTLDGRLLQDKPTRKGVYVVNGKVKVIK